MNNSESARKLNQAVNNTSKVVGEALSQAKGAFSSFWSTFTAPNANAAPTDSTESHPKVDANNFEPKEVTEPKEGVIKHIAKKFHNNDLSLKQEKDTGANRGGIVEIGREANTLDLSRQSEVIDAQLSIDELHFK